MDSNQKEINFNKRYKLDFLDGSASIIEFSIEQTLYPEEQKDGLLAYECYLLDNDNEATLRIIYYYEPMDDVSCIGQHHICYYSTNGEFVKKEVNAILPNDVYESQHLSNDSSTSTSTGPNNDQEQWIEKCKSHDELEAKWNDYIKSRWNDDAAKFII